MSAPLMDPALVRELFDYRDGGLYWRKAPGGKGHSGGRMGCIGKLGYRVSTLGGRQYKEHRLVWAWHHGVWPAAEVDHVNGTKDDNRIENLRDVSRTVNAQNQRHAHPTSRTDRLGVAWQMRAPRPGAKIVINGASVWLGTFDTPEEAHQAYLAAKRQLHAGNTL